MRDKCTFCQGEGYIEDISDCCAEKRDPDTMLCYKCHDHCGPMECDECGGKGYLLIEWNDEGPDEFDLQNLDPDMKVFNTDEL